MKKSLTLIATLAIIGLVSSNEIQATTNSNSISASAEISSTANTRSITVHMIKLNGHLWVKATKKAIYDSDNNTIQVDGNSYSIRANSYSGGGRENYDYQAGGIYFFNL